MVLLVSDLVELVAATFAPKRWLMVEDFPTPVSPRTRRQVW